MPRTCFCGNIVFIFSVFLFVAVKTNEIQRKCKSQCQGFVNEANQGQVCGLDCRVRQCQRGCGLYRDAITLSCPTVCNQVKNIRDDYIYKGDTCIQGCEIALNMYAQRIKDQLGPLVAPTLAPGTKRPKSIALRWSPRFLSNVTYRLEMKNLDLNSDWSIYGKIPQFLRRNHITVTSLHPYTTYKFRVVAEITASHALLSEDSLPITTIHYGRPSSAPKITSLTAPSPTVISVSWLPPVYPNGPLLGYRIHIRSNSPHKSSVNKEVLSNVTSWSFPQLTSTTTYTVSLSAWNSAGEGAACLANITTPKHNNLTKEETPYLIMGVNNFVTKLELNQYIDGRKEIYRNSNRTNRIKGIALHVRRDLVFISDSRGRVARSLVSDPKIRPRLYRGLCRRPTHLSVDWLADRLYVVCDRQIFTCHIDLSRCDLAIRRLPSSPSDIKVDPINGYLYLAMALPKSGLYRINLSQIYRRTKPISRLLIAMNDLKAFFMDYENIRLYFPNETQNTVMSTFIDGTDLMDIRQNVVSPQFRNIISMTLYNNEFYWTDGNEAWSESFDPKSRRYFHSRMMVFEKYARAFNVFHPTLQPLPVPHNAPGNVRVLFSNTSANITWQHPPRLIFQSDGAWDRWQYDIVVRDKRDLIAKQAFRVDLLSHVVTGLDVNSEYRVSVRAVYRGVYGPWSPSFIGRTFKKVTPESHPPSVLLSTAHTIIGQSLDGRFSQTISVRSLYDDYNAGSYMDVAWLTNNVYWVTSNGQVFNAHPSRPATPMHWVGKATSIAVDWLTHTLYYSNVRQGVIRRTHISATPDARTDIVYQSPARHMSIDSLSGNLYWTTSHSVEAACLNGEHPVRYMSVPYFGHQVISGLALDFINKQVLWLVQSYDSNKLYTAPMLKRDRADWLDATPTARYVADLESVSEWGMLEMFEGRLLWVDRDNRLMIADTRGNFSASVTQPLDSISSFIVAHPSQHPYPAGYTPSSLVIIPTWVYNDSIQIEGVWSLFNITWRPATDVNYGKVFYEISIVVTPQRHYAAIRDTTWYTLTDIPPYTPLTIILRPYTYWGYARPTNVVLHSPMSVPGETQTPRVYVTHRRSDAASRISVAADFRWTPPHTINGVIDYHVVHYCYKSRGTDKNCETQQVPGTHRHFMLDNLIPDATYYFTVQTCTLVGCGPKSAEVKAIMEAENPIPKLLVITKDRVMLSEIDRGLNSTVTVAYGSPVRALTYLAQDDTVLWCHGNGSIMQKLSISRKQQTKILELSDYIEDMAVDWVSRVLYMAVTTTNGTSYITSYDMERRTTNEVIVRGGHIKNILADPYTSCVIWSESDKVSGVGRVSLLSTKNGTITRTLPAQLPPRRRRGTDSVTCSCDTRQRLGSAIALYHSMKGSTELFFVDEERNEIVVTDLSMCHCAVAASGLSQSQGLRLLSLTVDHVHVYWSDDTKYVHVLDKLTLQHKRFTAPDNVKYVMSFGQHLQPLPGRSCLEPSLPKEASTITHLRNTSIHVVLHEASKPLGCQTISAPATMFTVLYRMMGASPTTSVCTVNHATCTTIESFNKSITIGSLRPYTTYVMHVAVSNYYTEYQYETLSPPAMYTTQPGVPSPPRNITAKTLLPTAVQISWNAPLEPNGPVSSLRYAIQWVTTTKAGVKQVGYTNSSSQDAEVASGTYSVITRDLLPNHKYDFTVLVYEGTRTWYTESRQASAKTFDTPRPIELIDSNQTALHVQWKMSVNSNVHLATLSHAQCEGITDYSDLIWNSDVPMPPHRRGNESTFTYSSVTTNLRSYMLYCFRLEIVYQSQQSMSWPPDTRFSFRTSAGVPKQPSPPIIIPVNPGPPATYMVKWSEPEMNGGDLLQYYLQYKTGESNWTLVYNGTDPVWLVDPELTPPTTSYLFRVCALNTVGYGPYSYNSTAFTMPVFYKKDDHGQSLTVAVTASVVAVVAIMVLILIWITYHRRKMDKRAPINFTNGNYTPDVELANLRGLPHSGFQNNSLYIAGCIPTDEDIAALPHFSREHLSLKNFLGRGAFGEVYEGVAVNILGADTGDTKVAVKTLRKCASDQEKEEFLREALLMSNFRHEHIISLLGVCLNNDPQFIILELMEGGDLLSFLRKSRSTMSTANSLTLQDLVKVCVHVARGCQYLEDMHFVHRDLAARNCLVSSMQPSDLIVKIGDFGLARDIYKNDYYRKEGEGLLPVRWMSPESLVDGVFTTQSDIWAFGVLSWEVITLGQQPYPAKTNMQVLEFVRGGGQLERPDNCPDDLFELMLKCWDPEAELRPTFAMILTNLESLYMKTTDVNWELRYTFKVPSDGDGCSAQASRMTVASAALPDSMDAIGKVYNSTESLDDNGDDEAHDTFLRQRSDSGYLIPRHTRTPKYIELISDAHDGLLPKDATQPTIGYAHILHDTAPPQRPETVHCVPHFHSFPTIHYAQISDNEIDAENIDAVSFSPSHDAVCMNRNCLPRWQPADNGDDANEDPAIYTDAEHVPDENIDSLKCLINHDRSGNEKEETGLDNCMDCTPRGPYLTPRRYAQSKSNPVWLKQPRIPSLPSVHNNKIYDITSTISDSPTTTKHHRNSGCRETLC